MKIFSNINTPIQKSMKRASPDDDHHHHDNNTLPPSKSARIPSHRGAFKKHLGKQGFMINQKCRGRVWTGILVSCDVSREAESIQPVSSLFTEIVRKHWGEGKSENEQQLEVEPTVEEEEPEEETEEEADGIQLKHADNIIKHSKFVKVIDSGCSGLLYFAVDRKDVNAVELFQRVWDHVKETNLLESNRLYRFVHRFIPCEAICVANTKDILELVRKIQKEKLKEGDTIENEKKEKKTFAIRVEVRNNVTVSKADLINEVAKMFPYVVNLTNPDIVIIIQVFKSVCGVSIIENDAGQYRNFNLRQIQQKN